ncbi:killer cell lectin-like receptor subfamily F member 1 [Numenius arquata]|uniref:killer cell lectin-like receptor subfamily F member 1 n=1 Tax=Numenius arquata TaxID=31919 RepID=UPI003D309357
MPQGQGPVAALTNIYAEPDRPLHSGPSGRRKRPGPWWYWLLMGAGWVGTGVLAGVVVWLLQQGSGNGPVLRQDTAPCSWATCLPDPRPRDIPEIKCSLHCFQHQLRQRLCQLGSHPTAGTAGPGACWLCPAGWQPFAAKCYWVSTKTEAWEMAAENCQRKGAQLVILESLEEKAFIGEMMGNASVAWMGLRIHLGRETEWTWKDGSPLQKALSPVVGPKKDNACGAIGRGRLRSHICSTPLYWICQKEATEI